ncbi:MAG: alpha/beta hydrolase [Lachnospiraceae bacterium]|nr:alpha/beta hydrolase [Lachnospiraceae bacterium]
MPQFENTAQGKVLRDLVARLHSDNLIGRKIKNGELRKIMEEAEWRVPNGYSLSVIVQKHFSMELLEPKEPSRRMIILQLHGGGYVGKMINVYRSFAGLYSELGRGVSVLTPDYRVAPEDPYPAALEDAVHAYDWLLENHWSEEQIVVAGDSAGGGLALALCMYLKDRKRPLPAGIVGMSPWTDLAQSGSSYHTNYRIDPVFGNTRDSLIYNKDYVGDEDVKNPYISPLYGDFSGFPPMLLQVGSQEMLLSDSEGVAEKARHAGVKVRLSIYEGMFHVFQMALLMIPESKKAWKEVGVFLDRIFPPDLHLCTGF